MKAWPIAEDLSPNQRSTNYDKIAVVIHTEAGHEAATDTEFDDPNSELSSNGSVALTGYRIRHVAFKRVAYANGIVDNDSVWWTLPEAIASNPNDQTVSFETEDNGQPDTQEVTPDQYESVRDWINTEVKANCPKVKYILGHNDIYSGHSCPAARWYDSGKLKQLAQDTGLQYISRKHP